MTYPQAIIAAAVLIAGAIFLSAPRYRIISTPTWNVVWRVNTSSGETAYCSQGEGSCIKLSEKDISLVRNVKK